MNVGQILETHLGWAGFVLGEKITRLLQENTRMLNHLPAPKSPIPKDVKRMK